MPHCFVMQPFDGGVFDSRYEDVYAPAIKDADLEPYRVDRDPQVVIPIQDIEKGIKDSRICLADISLDNPNVWFELGYAIALNKEVVLVCSEERTTRFPFDVQHRTIIKYKTGAPRDFVSLRESITSKLKALLEKEESIYTAANPSVLQPVEGLEQVEVVVMAAIGGNADSPEDFIGVGVIKNDMEKAGFTNIATTMALRTLSKRKLIENKADESMYGDYQTYCLTNAGWEWMLENKRLFVLKQAPVSPPTPPGWDDPIPF
ncbi:hypothetical protein [Pseudomonas sp. WS 5410]|uniref:hypothetical protein n=1 Tax=Pseudomonas sp. WS 5410 TaxID=2717485 RepID=UPI0014741EE2|nr:hypothetical protein [Pseudomonas sp. WS 5410]NMY21140.1 hypothetical protein [Pseudomonas sp. WS 5410]